MLIAGGGETFYTPPAGEGQAGVCSVGPTTHSELFDPATGGWTATGEMPNPVITGLSSVTLASGKALVVGTSRYPVESAAQLYDPATGTWKFSKPTLGTDPNAASPFVFHALPLNDGRVIALGECTLPNVNSHCTDSQLYDPATDRWSASLAVPSPLASYAATLASDGEIVLSGGIVAYRVLRPGSPTPREVFQNTPDVLARFSGSSAWNSAGTLPEPRSRHFSVRLANGSILIVGGMGGVDGSKPLTRAVIGSP